MMQTSPNEAEASSSAAIALEDVVFHWPHQRKADHNPPTLIIPHWQVDRGQRVFIHGKSGSGKSTLLNIIAGIITPQSGCVDLLGSDLVHFNQHQRDRFRARHLGVIFQQFNLVPYLSVADNIKLSQHFANVALDQLTPLDQLLSHLGLSDSLLERKARELSVGQQQRVAVARALYHRPDIIIADEPTSALDADTRDEFISLLLSETEQTQSTVLFVSHDKSLAKHFDQLVELEDLNQAVQHNVF